MHKIILIERDASKYASWKNLEQKKRIPEMSVEQIVKNYRGFEGEILEVCDVNEKDSDLEKHISELSELKDLGICFLLFIRSSSSSIPSYIELNCLKLGYDVGVCVEEEEEVYSSIFQEILFGVVEELVMFKSKLNDNFLFNDKSTAIEYVEAHNEMSLQGKDVEDYMPMSIYEVWSLG